MNIDYKHCKGKQKHSTRTVKVNKSLFFFFIWYRNIIKAEFIGLLNDFAFLFYCHFRSNFSIIYFAMVLKINK